MPLSPTIEAEEGRLAARLDRRLERDRVSLDGFQSIRRRSLCRSGTAGRQQAHCKNPSPHNNPHQND